MNTVGNIFVSDGYKNHCVHKFSRDGELLPSWGEKGLCPVQFSSVHCAWVDRHDRIWVCDRENLRIQLFGSNGGYLKEFNALPKPHALVFDQQDEVVYVAELWQISIYTLEGELIAR